MKFGALSLVACVSAHNGIISDSEYRFMKFITEEGRSYGTVAEYQFRLAQF